MKYIDYITKNALQINLKGYIHPIQPRDEDVRIWCESMMVDAKNVGFSESARSRIDDVLEKYVRKNNISYCAEVTNDETLRKNIRDMLSEKGWTENMINRVILDPSKITEYVVFCIMNRFYQSDSDMLVLLVDPGDNPIDDTSICSQLNEIGVGVQRQILQAMFSSDSIAWKPFRSYNVCSFGNRYPIRYTHRTHLYSSGDRYNDFNEHLHDDIIADETVDAEILAAAIASIERRIPTRIPRPNLLTPPSEFLRLADVDISLEISADEAISSLETGLIKTKNRLVDEAIDMLYRYGYVIDLSKYDPEAIETAMVANHRRFIKHRGRIAGSGKDLKRFLDALSTTMLDRANSKTIKTSGIKLKD